MANHTDEHGKSAPAQSSIAKKMRLRTIVRGQRNPERKHDVKIEHKYGQWTPEGRRRTPSAYKAKTLAHFAGQRKEAKQFASAKREISRLRTRGK